MALEPCTFLFYSKASGKPGSWQLKIQDWLCLSFELPPENRKLHRPWGGALFLFYFRASGSKNRIGFAFPLSSPLKIEKSHGLRAMHFFCFTSELRASPAFA
jgi:hypothetical protein